jgi:hypothetical protein
MRFLRSIVLAALLLSTAANAAIGSIGNATTDAVTITVDGMKVATARWIVLTAGTAKVTTEITLDGVNWLPSAYSYTVNTVSANPAITSWQNLTPVVNSYDTPLPANALGFRVRCGTTGTLTTVQVTGGQPYTPNEPVWAVLFDASESGTGAGLDTGTLDVSGWVVLYLGTKAPGATNAVNYYLVDDAGNSTSNAFGAQLTVATGTTSTVGWGPANPTPALSSLPRRIRGLIAAGGTVSAGRIRIEARR